MPIKSAHYSSEVISGIILIYLKVISMLARLIPAVGLGKISIDSFYCYILKINIDECNVQDTPIIMIRMSLGCSTQYCMQYYASYSSLSAQHSKIR